MLESSWVNLICLASDPYNNDKYAQQLKQRMGKKNGSPVGWKNPSAKLPF